jgi:hypothetical protein
MTYIKHASPIQVVLSNDTNESKPINLFGSSYNEFVNKDIKSGIPYVTYEHIQKTLLSTAYFFDLMRLEISSLGKKGKTDIGASCNNLKKLVITVGNSDINGQACYIPIIVGSYIDKKQFQKCIVDINYNVILDDSTQLNFNVPPKSTIVVSIFPYKVKKNNETRYYGYSGLISSIKDIKHKFSDILINKINEADKLKKEYDEFEDVKSHKQYFQLEDYYFDATIDNMLSKLHDIPSDLYRNMIDLYTELDWFIGDIKKKLQKVNDMVKFEKKFKPKTGDIDELLNKSKGTLSPKKSVSKIKENSNTLNFVSSKINKSKVAPNKKSVNKTSKK